MSKKDLGHKTALAGFDDIFMSTTNPHATVDGETIVHIPLTELHPPEFHPFQVKDDESMTRLVKSIQEHGVLDPGRARPRAGGGYELLCGNRRKRACEIAEIAALPVIVRDYDDDSATIVMIDSNLEQREELLYSEKAWAYRLKLEALNHQGVKGDVPGQLSVDILCEQTGEKKSQIFRLIRLTELIVALIDKVDAKQLAFNPAVELSYLSQIEQTAVADAMKKYAIKPSLSQAKRLKKMKQSGKLALDKIDAMLSETKKPPKDEPAGSLRFRKYFPPEYSQKQMDAVIASLLKDWQTQQERSSDGGAAA